jgi:hypothetical protein
MGHQLSANGPLAVIMDASAYQFYKSGVMAADAPCSKDYAKINHALALEGLGTDAATGQRFWIIRNWSRWAEITHACIDVSRITLCATRSVAHHVPLCAVLFLVLQLVRREERKRAHDADRGVARAIDIVVAHHVPLCAVSFLVLLQGSDVG